MNYKNLHFLKKGIFQNELLEYLNKKDGLIAIVFVSIYLIFFYLLTKCWFTPAMQNSHLAIFYPRIYLTSLLLLHQIPMIFLLCIVLRKANHSISTIGFRQRGLKSSILVGVILLSIYIYKYQRLNGFDFEMFYYLYYYLINIGFEEEIVFRGYLWPRLVVLLGNFWGTTIACVFFGLAHSIIPIILGIHSQGVGDWIGAGLVGHLFYAYIYTRNNNIMLPIFIHGFLDLPYTQSI
ncbi:CPBP family intramembrane metalloprotease [Bacillus mobilis]|uniref:CPBP family intramembrane glutamic endopeptidase n=1 Tax=Bacillus mobilis TaxID=2026190 RepID=UPI0021CD73DA|nr:CPBP family intramembrane glutamic endopeptidase [Bacillus mobilis]MCU5436021.1 CPBP family intramembrane metalloprotease [Bacillus mobilis]